VRAALARVEGACIVSYSNLSLASCALARICRWALSDCHGSSYTMGIMCISIWGASFSEPLHMHQKNASESFRAAQLSHLPRLGLIDFGRLLALCDQ
jgi:hypothetical protein